MTHLLASYAGASIARIPLEGLKLGEGDTYVCQPKSDPLDRRKVTHLGLGEADVIIEKCPI
jgi:hypothetical protein